jgi:hypothetical protein
MGGDSEVAQDVVSNADAVRETVRGQANATISTSAVQSQAETSGETGS